MSFNSSFDSEGNNEISTAEESHSIIKKINSSLLRSISLTLSKVIYENKALKNYNRKVKEQSTMAFSASSPPAISLYDYLCRIKEYGDMEDSTLIIALIYIDRLCDITSLVLTPLNIHRVLFASIIVAVKFNEDKIYDNKYYSEIAGVSLKELSKIEGSFVDMIKFNLYVEKMMYDKYQSYLSTIEEKLQLEKSSQL